MKKFKKVFGFVSQKNADEQPPTKHKEPKRHMAPVEELPAVEDPVPILIEKLKKGNRQASALPEDELLEWARSLCVKSDLKECYLNAEFAKTATLFNDLNSKMTKVDKTSSSSIGGIIPISSSSMPESAPHRPEQLEDTDFDLSELEAEHKLSGHYKDMAQVKVKLVIAEICKSDMQRTLRRMLSPVLTKFDHQQQFGMFHSALIVGPWYIEWNNSSLCIPRKCYSNAAIIAADMTLPGKQNTVNLDEAIDKISEIVIKWNTHFTYDQQNYNCQTFVDEIAIALGFDLNDFDGPLGMFLKNLRQKGECSLDFPISNDMREKFGIRETSKTFSTHRELDEFVKFLMSKDALFETSYPGHWMLLKSFDRAFWLRHFKDKENDKFKPLEMFLTKKKDDDSDSDSDSDSESSEHEEEGCPFKDPHTTASMKKDWF